MIGVSSPDRALRPVGKPGRPEDEMPGGTNSDENQNAAPRGHPTDFRRFYPCESVSIRVIRVLIFTFGAKNAGTVSRQSKAK